MKLTKQRIKEIIKEEIENMENDDMETTKVDPQALENTYNLLESLGLMLGGLSATELIKALYSKYIENETHEEQAEE